MIENELPRSLRDNPLPSDWLSFDVEGRVRLATGKVELGQGILTALVQLAAEELCVDPARIHIVSGETGRSPEEVFTSGSQSIEISGTSIQYMSAIVRERLIEAAANDLGASAEHLSVNDGQVASGGRATGHSYWSERERLLLSEPPTGAPPLRGGKKNRFVGKSLPRLDLPDKVFGSGFIQDIELPNMCHAAVLRGPVRGALLRDFDEAGVRRAATVEIFRRGSFVALIGSSEHAVRKALFAARASARWDLPPLDPAMADPRRFIQSPTVDRVLQNEFRHEVEGTPFCATFSRPFLAHASIGLCTAIAVWDGVDLTVFTHSQGVGPLRAAIAKVLHLDVERVHVAHRHGAGAYGQNGADDAALDAAVIALAHLGTPVRVQWMREDELSVPPFGSAMAVRVSAVRDAASKVRNWQMEIWSCSHGRRPGMGGTINLMAASEIASERERTIPFDVPDQAGGGGTRNALAPYDFAEQTISYHLLVDQPLQTSSIRALGAQLNVFAIESCMDELAELAGIDPLDYRLDHLSEPRLREVLENVAAMSNWRSRGEGGTGTGLGLGVSRYKNKSGYAAVAAEVEVAEEVRVVRIWCAADCGLVVNPDGALNQLEGGIIQAVSWALKEQVRFDETGIVSCSWDKYPILRFSEVPEVEIRLLSGDRDEPLGVGEIATGPTTAAIGNAIAHALGVRIRDLPFTRERIISAMMA